MKKNILLLSATLLIFVANLSAQPWLDNLPSGKEKKDLTLFELQEAFNSYWSAYDIENGWYTDEKGVKQKAYGWKQFKRSEQFWKNRVNQETGEFPNTTAAAEYKKAAKKYSYSRSSSGNWTNLGISSSDGGYYGIGRVSSVAFHPTDANTIWAATPAGGLWVTKVGGNDWLPLTDNNDVLGVSAIIIPSDYETSSTIYIGTGDRDAQDNYSVGVLKSTDEGVSWQSTGLTFEPYEKETVNAMLINPANDNEIIAATTAGLFKTVDAGANWTSLSVREFIDIEYQPGNTSRIYASTRGGSIYVTSDDGVNWSQNFTDQANRIELAVSPDATQRVYAIASNSGNGLKGIYRSDDAGVTFSLIYNSKNLMGWEANGGDSGGQGWYDLALACDPTNADNLYMGGVNSWKSTDGGYSWQLSSHWYGGGGVIDVHADKHFLKYRNNTSDVFECNDGGLYIKTNTQNWTSISNGIVNSQIYKMGTAQTVPDVSVVGLQDNGTKLRENGTWYPVLGGDGMDCAVDPTNENIQYGSLYYGAISRTSNGWNSSSEISNNIPDPAEGAWVTPFVLDPTNPSTIYVGYTKLWKSTNSGQSFTMIGNFSFDKLDALAVAPSDPNVIYASTGGAIWKTVNAGDEWLNIIDGLGPFNSSISQITVKQDDPNTVWLASTGYDANGVLQTTDGGVTWSDISAGLPEIPVSSVVHNKLETSIIQLYAGTDFGVYVKNGPSNWVPFATGLPNVVVSELEIYYDNLTPENSKLRAATYGRGIWESDMDLSGNFAPYVETVSVGSITTSTAIAIGETLYDFGSSAIENGIVYSLNRNPDLGEAGVSSATSMQTGNGQFSADLTGLLPGETYYYRAYSTNAHGTGYGIEMSFVSGCTSIATNFWEENLEEISPAINCWTQTPINGTDLEWVLARGNGASSPSYAQEGHTNLLLKSSNPTAQRVTISSPVFDFSGQSNLSLSFWHVHQSLFSFKDTLRVLYRTSAAGEWNELVTLGDPQVDWKKEIIDLPNLSDEYSFAFEGITGGAHGIGVDNIRVGDFSDISDITEPERFTIYPNPSEKGTFYIKPIDTTLDYTIKVYDLTGKVVLVKDNISTDKDYQVRIQDAVPGLYFVQISSNGTSQTTKVILK